jgi:hypothetical protein
VSVEKPKPSSVEAETGSWADDAFMGGSSPEEDLTLLSLTKSGNFMLIAYSSC